VTKPRSPLSTEQALQRIAGQLASGVQSMAEVADRQTGTVRAWMDPDRPEQVPFECAIALDLAFQAEGGEGAPLFEVYATAFKLASAQRFASRRRLLDFTSAIAKEAGEAVAALVHGARDDAGEAERRLAAREVDEAIAKLIDVRPLLEPEVFHASSSASAADSAAPRAPP
jgi:hypothetical protein